MTIFLKLIFDQTTADRRQYPPLLTQCGRETTMIQEMAPTVFLPSDLVLTGYQVKPSILESAYSN